MSLSRPLVLIITIIGAATFGLGYIVGRSGEPPIKAPIASTNLAGNGSSHLQAAVAAIKSAETAAFKGRITFKTEAGVSRPDRGSRVLVFPQERAGEARLSVAGFRAGDFDG